MSTYQSLLLGIRSSADYFISTFMFGVMFGIAASAAGLSQWQALLMSATAFTASGQFAALEFWQSPLPYGTIALSVALISSRNILLGMAMTHHFGGHSLKRRIVWLFLRTKLRHSCEGRNLINKISVGRLDSCLRWNDNF